jgi:ankyrin repeat protein
MQAYKQRLYKLFYTGVTPVWIASVQGFTPILVFLIQKGVVVDTATERGESPLIAAAQEGNIDTLEVLINAGADLNFENPSNGCTAIISATMRGQYQCLDLLLQQKKVDIEKEFRVVNRNSFFQLTSDRKRAIHIAASNNNDQCLQLLVEKGAEINARDSDGYTGKKISMYFNDMYTYSCTNSLVLWG